MKTLGGALIVRLYRHLRPRLERLEQQYAAPESRGLTPGLLHFPGFLIRLQEEIARAARYQRELGLLVFEVAHLSHRQQRGVEVALRDALRQTDVPARLSDHMLGALLPETGPGAAAAAVRLGHLLAGVAKSPIDSGYARYPADGNGVADLLRIATERSSPPSATLRRAPLPPFTSASGGPPGASSQPGPRPGPQPSPPPHRSRCRWSRTGEFVPSPLPWYL
jgi:hypothetical protein